MVRADALRWEGMPPARPVRHPPSTASTTPTAGHRPSPTAARRQPPPNAADRRCQRCCRRPPPSRGSTARGPALTPRRQGHHQRHPTRGLAVGPKARRPMSPIRRSSLRRCRLSSRCSSPPPHPLRPLRQIVFVELRVFESAGRRERQGGFSRVGAPPRVSVSRLVLFAPCLGEGSGGRGGRWRVINGRCRDGRRCRHG